jgi:hypothetical protein
MKHCDDIFHHPAPFQNFDTMIMSPHSEMKYFYDTSKMVLGDDFINLASAR